MVAKVTQVASLLMAGGHGVYRCLPDLGQRGGRGMPAHDRTRVRRPVVDGPERLFARDEHISSVIAPSPGHSEFIESGDGYRGSVMTRPTAHLPPLVGS